MFLITVLRSVPMSSSSNGPARSVAGPWGPSLEYHNYLYVRHSYNSPTDTLKESIVYDFRIDIDLSFAY